MWRRNRRLPATALAKPLVVHMSIIHITLSDSLRKHCGWLLTCVPSGHMRQAGGG